MYLRLGADLGGVAVQLEVAAERSRDHVDGRLTSDGIAKRIGREIEAWMEEINLPHKHLVLIWGGGAVHLEVCTRLLPRDHAEGPTHKHGSIPPSHTQQGYTPRA